MFKPILAAPLLKPTDKHDDDTIYKVMQGLRYPVIASLKKDGIRALRMADTLRSRTLKLIPNISIRSRASILPYGFDMELWNPDLAYDEIQSIVMSEEHEGSEFIHFHMLDRFDLEQPYVQRHKNMVDRIMPLHSVQSIWYDSLVLCQTARELMDEFYLYESSFGEGICFRTPDSPYKQGRSTLKEQYLVKLCRNITREYTITGFEEQLTNTNRTKHNSVGNMARSSFKSGMVPNGILGKFLCKSSETGMEIKVGTGVGLTDKLRLEIWNNRDKWLGKQIVVKSKAHGVKVKPRMPIYVGLREEGF